LEGQADGVPAASPTPATGVLDLNVEASAGAGAAAGVGGRGVRGGPGVKAEPSEGLGVAGVVGFESGWSGWGFEHFDTRNKGRSEGAQHLDSNMMVAEGADGGRVEGLGRGERRNGQGRVVLDGVRSGAAE